VLAALCDTGRVSDSPRAPRNNRKALARNSSNKLGSPPRPAQRDRRQQVLDVAIEMFHERGFSGTSVEDVASAVGLLKGSLYYYIDSKQDLLYKIVAEVHVDVERIFAEATADTSESPLERLTEYARQQVEYNARNVERISVYYHEWERLEDSMLVEVRKKRRQHEKAVIVLLEAAKAAGEIDAGVDTRLAASCVFATIIWPYTWYRPGKLSPRELADFCASFLLAGLKSATESAGRRSRAA
jgi:TetR/AcrR family transcriptional regulator, cholesterol catabolism regulator